MRILVIEDDTALHRILSKRLKEVGHSVDGCYDGEEGLNYARALEYDCIILDLMLPKKDGISILRELRSYGNVSPVMVLTAKDSITDRVTGLDAGADDYLTKPFSFEELSARLRALLRRSGDTKEIVLKLADLMLNTATHTVMRAGQSILLTSKEYALLEYLLRNQGHIQTRSQISDHVWNYEFNYDSNIVDVYIRYLRNKVDKDFSAKLIHTIRGFGYVMREENA
ncbi:response regulator transcription factor [Paenibacillus sp. HW567]|uniref:response regulator transcription factor n=1 Tax=Paenibacillus sp. HW567 TaxID=1034769 RepID=UPI0003740DB2|nr:response regulator transcription factor [Paenibacillus sp. HW567]